GVDNEIILSNLVELSKMGANIHIRIPFIKGVNDDEQNMIDTAKFISNLSGDRKKISILPYHNIASVKYNKLGGIYNENGMSTPSDTSIANFISIFEKHELHAIIGG
ncbi:MAG: hypothetical protein KAG37_00285, partial [Flavobacteriales bacterium]|nr:hypothetical protein [Flavobacteriales bacterium]